MNILGLIKGISTAKTVYDEAKEFMKTPEGKVNPQIIWQLSKAIDLNSIMRRDVTKLSGFIWLIYMIVFLGHICALSLGYGNPELIKLGIVELKGMLLYICAGTAAVIIISFMVNYKNASKGV